jgi:CDP-diglyceride synthetase
MKKEIERKQVSFMKKSTLFYGGIIIAIVAVVLAIYYLIPGIYHPLTNTPPLSSHPTHALLFFAIAVVCVIGALVNRPRSVQR